MAYARTRPHTAVELLGNTRSLTIPGSHELLSERRLRRWSKARHRLYHRPKNGAHDPISFFHLTEELLHIHPGTPFTAANLAEYLNKVRTQLLWDPVVVGRILNDLIESWNEANPVPEAQPLAQSRHWSGRRYTTAAHPEARAVLAATIDDLARRGEAYRDTIDAGLIVKRLTSPLVGLASLLIPAAQAEVV